MIRKTKVKSSFFVDPNTSTNNHYYFSDDQKIEYVNQNITTFAELQTLSNLSVELHNESYGHKSKTLIAQILSKSETLYIDNIMENFDRREQSEAARLIATIISNNPHLKTISLENNQFSKSDLSMVINAILEAKENKFLKSSLQEIYLRNSVRVEIADDVIPKLIALKKKHDLKIDLSPIIVDAMKTHQADRASTLRKKN
jgi:hypothetical protein